MTYMIVPASEAKSLSQKLTALDLVEGYPRDHAPAGKVTFVGAAAVFTDVFGEEISIPRRAYEQMVAGKRPWPRSETATDVIVHEDGRIAVKINDAFLRREGETVPIEDPKDGRVDVKIEATTTELELPDRQIKATDPDRWTVGSVRAVDERAAIEVAVPVVPADGRR